MKSAHAADAATAALNIGAGIAVWVQWLQGLEAVIALGFALVLGYLRVRITLREWQEKKKAD